MHIKQIFYTLIHSMYDPYDYFYLEFNTAVNIHNKIPSVTYLF